MNINWEEVSNITGMCAWVLMMIVFYFLPTIIAMSTKHKELGAVFMLNLFAGWSGIGWIGAIVWAALGKTPGIDIDINKWTRK